MKEFNMNINTTELLDDSIKMLKECSAVLEEISSTCCMPERSKNINDAQSALNHIITVSKETYTYKQNAEKCIESIGNVGSKIGFLYATCCTPTREIMYRNILKKLSTVHGNMWSVLGHSH